MILSRYLRFPVRLSVILIAGFIGRMLLFSNATLMGKWVDALASKSEQSSDHYFFWLLGVTALGLGLTVFFRIALARLSCRVVSELHDEVVIKVSRFPARFFDTQPVGRILTRFSSDYGNVFRFFGGPFSELLSLAFDLTAMFVLIGLSGRAFAGIYAVYGAAATGIYLFRRGWLNDAKEQLGRSRGPGIAHFAETVQGVEVIRAFDRTQVFQDRFLEQQRIYVRARETVTDRVSLFSMQLAVLQWMIFVSLSVVGLLGISKGTTTVGQLASVLSFCILAGNTLTFFFEWYGQLDDALVGVRRLQEYIDVPMEPLAQLPQGIATPTTSLSRPPKIEFRNIWFRYADDLPWVWKDQSLTIEPFEKVAITGPTGIGKSSLFQLLLQMYPLDQGKLLLGGRNVEEWGLDAWREQFALIPQDPILFRGTVRDNLDPLNRHSDADLDQWLAKVGLGAWRARFGSKPLNQIAVQENGKNLSLGERQLLCLTRALLSPAQIFLLDEPTSSVDPAHEQSLMLALDTLLKDKTVLMIAHRPDSWRKMERRVDLASVTTKAPAPL